MAQPSHQSDARSYSDELDQLGDRLQVAAEKARRKNLYGLAEQLEESVRSCWSWAKSLREEAARDA
jgi:hypothetical protein